MKRQDLSDELIYEDECGDREESISASNHDEWIDYEVTNDEEARFIKGYFKEYDDEVARKKRMDRLISVGVVVFCILFIVGVFMIVSKCCGQ